MICEMGGYVIFKSLMTRIAVEQFFCVYWVSIIPSRDRKRKGKTLGHQIPLSHHLDLFIHGPDRR